MPLADSSVALGVVLSAVVGLSSVAVLIAVKGGDKCLNEVLLAVLSSVGLETDLSGVEGLNDAMLLAVSSLSAEVGLNELLLAVDGLLRVEEGLSAR